MNKIQLYREIGLVDDDLIAEAETVDKKGVWRKTWGKWGAVAACVTIAIVISAFRLFPLDSDFDLMLSTGNIKVKYTDNAPTNYSSGSLVPLTEDELLTEADTAIFKGTIEEIRNIEVDFNGWKVWRKWERKWKFYWAIAKITVDEVYRGECAEGDTVSVLLPCPIDNGIWVEDTDVISSMRVGMSGIFMPMQYDETSYGTIDNATIYWREIAEYGFRDGERYAFLETDSGLIFSRSAYKSIAAANSLDEIELYIIEMIK